MNAKRKKPIRKIAKSTLLKRALKKCERAWSQAVKRRDRNICQVHGVGCNRGPKQSDHFQSRKHASTFLDIRNGTWVCAHANHAKAMGWENMGWRIGRIVEKREGPEAVDKIILASKRPKKWTLLELEEIEQSLNRMFLPEKEN